MLCPGEVHIWRVSIPAPPSELGRCRNILSDDERTRADRFKFDEHRDAYTSTRATLRIVLAQYLNECPEALVFDVNKYGKPALKLATNVAGIHFNVSHSKAYALFAFDQGAPLGIDVEWIRPVEENIADLLLSSPEKAAFEKLPMTQRLASLFHIWTSKEAIIKALGKGLSISLKDIQVQIDPQLPPALLHMSPQVGQEDDWKIYGLKIDPEYSAAVAVNANTRQLKRWTWSLAHS